MPTTTSVIVTSGASGTKIEEVVVEASSTGLTATTVAGLVYVFLYDGSTYHLFDTIPVTAVVAAAAGPGPFRVSRTYTNLWMKSGWSLRASQSIVGNASLLKFIAFGGDL